MSTLFVRVIIMHFLSLGVHHWNFDDVWNYESAKVFYFSKTICFHIFQKTLSWGWGRSSGRGRNWSGGSRTTGFLENYLEFSKILTNIHYFGNMPCLVYNLHCSKTKLWKLFGIAETTQILFTENIDIVRYHFLNANSILTGVPEALLDVVF